jgi:hypothetical protein
MPSAIVFRNIIVKRIFALASLLFSGLSCAATEWNDNQIAINGSSVSLALPSNFIRMQNSHPTYVYTAKIYSGTNSNLLAGYHCNREFPYVLVVQFTQSVNYKYTPEKWKEHLDDVKKQLAQFDAREVRQVLNDKLDRVIKSDAPSRDLAITMDTPVLLPIFDESMRHYSHLVLMGVKTSMDNATQQGVLVSSNTTIFVRDRLIHIYYYEAYIDKGTYAHVQNITKEMIRRTLEMNPD